MGSPTWVQFDGEPSVHQGHGNSGVVEYQLPQPSSSLHGNECLSYVLGEDGDDWDSGVESYLGEPSPLLPHDGVLVSTQLTLVPAPWSYPNQVTFLEHVRALFPVGGVRPARPSDHLESGDVDEDPIDNGPDHPLLAEHGVARHQEH